MSEPKYRTIEVVGTSEISIEGAVNNAVTITDKLIRNLRWVDIKEIRGSIANGQVDQWHVGLNLAFTRDSEEPTKTRLGNIKLKDYLNEKNPVSLGP